MCVDLKLLAVVFREFPACFEVYTPLSDLTLTQSSGQLFLCLLREGCSLFFFPPLMCSTELWHISILTRIEQIDM